MVYLIRSTQAAEKVLTEFAEDEQQVVRESCQVALNIIDYWAPVEHAAT